MKRKLTGFLVFSVLILASPILCVLAGPPHYASMQDQGEILSVAFSPNGKLLASGAQYCTTLWDVTSGKKLFTWPAGDFWIESIAFSPDGKILAAADGSYNRSEDEHPVRGHYRVINLYSPMTGKRLRTLRGHLQDIYWIAFSPDGRILASGSNDTIKLWDVATGKELRALKAHAWAVNSLAFSPDGKLVVSGGVDGPIKLWNITTGELISTLKPEHQFDDSVVTFSPNGHVLASGEDHMLAPGDDDSTIRLTSTTNWTTLRAWHVSHNAIRHLAFSPDGKKLASSCVDDVGDYENISFWDARSGKQLLKFRVNGAMSTISFSPDGRVFASGENYSAISLYDASNGKKLKTLGSANW